ncbi:MAG: mechanosensitive ion channel family protein [Gemmatimonadaceae bacterium]
MSLFPALDEHFLGNPLSAWVTAGFIVAGVSIVLLVIKHVVGWRLTAHAARTATDLDDGAADLFNRTRHYFILALALRAGAFALTLTDGAQEALRKGIGIVVLLQIAAWGNGLVTFWLRRWSHQRFGEHASSTTINAMGVLARGALWTIILLLALRNVLDYDITTLITGVGISGIAIALAVQNILGDLFAALSIVLDKPFDVGDTIAVDTFKGTVEHVGLKTTRVRSLGGEQVIFSNSDLLKSRVRNLRRMVERRALFSIGVTYDTPPDDVARIPAIIREIIDETPHARFDRAHFARFADSSLDFEVVYFTTSSDYSVFAATQHAVNLALLRRFNEESISFAFPTRRIIHDREGEAVGLPPGDGERLTE